MYQYNQDPSLPSGSNILRYIWTFRASAIYDIPINWRYIHKRCPALIYIYFHCSPRCPTLIVLMCHWKWPWVTARISPMSANQVVERGDTTKQLYKLKAKENAKRYLSNTFLNLFFFFKPAATVTTVGDVSLCNCAGKPEEHRQKWQKTF